MKLIDAKRNQSYKKRELKEILKDWLFFKDLLREVDYNEPINF